MEISQRYIKKVKLFENYSTELYMTNNNSEQSSFTYNFIRSYFLLNFLLQ
jgi:hypothetical protein